MPGPAFALLCLAGALRRASPFGLALPRAVCRLTLGLCLYHPASPCYDRRIRFIFFILIHTSLLVASVAIAHADDVDSRREYIVNGEPAGPGDIRGTVAVALLREEQAEEGFAPESLFSGAWCSGVLIAPNVVLTAGHCVEQCFRDTCTDFNGAQYDCYKCSTELIPADRVYIAAGSRTLDDLWHAEVVPVRELFVPEQYRLSAYWNLDLGQCEQLEPNQSGCEEAGLSPDIHDIAVLRLDAPITVLRPVRLLPSTDDLAGSEGLAIGYGDRTTPGSDELLTQDRYLSILQQTATPIEQVTEQEILTAAGENQSGVCFGDSGGPLYVQRGNDVFVAGVASRFRADTGSPYCEIGAIYTSVPAHADWIFEKAPEASRLTLSGGGGCATVAGTASAWGPLLIGLLLVLLALRARRRKVVLAAPFVLVAGALIGCGSSSASDVSFCNETRDPYGIFCNPDTERIDLQAAEAIARSEVPGDALLLRLSSSSDGLLDPDGHADSWRFTYYLSRRRMLPVAEFWYITVYPNEQTFVETFVTDAAGSGLTCIPTAPIPVLDSRQLTHEAIRFMESQGTTVRLGDGGNLFIVQDHICRIGDALRNIILYRRMAAYFDDEGGFFKLDDPPR